MGFGLGLLRTGRLHIINIEVSILNCRVMGRIPHVCLGFVGDGPFR
jgi:hypothetical protein